MLEASSPAKVILFGEHAVVYGEPAVAIALDRRISISVKDSNSFRVDGGKLSMRRHRYVRWAMENHWKEGPLEIRTRSRIPSASGLGSSAALSCSVCAALLEMQGSVDQETLAINAFEVEYNVQGGASPTDTSCSTHGGAVLINSEKGDDHLWTISKNDRTWHVHDIDPPDMTLVVGYTKKPSVTPIQVSKVRGFYERSGFARETITEIGELTLDGVNALRRSDIVELGSLMNRNHSLLSILGVNCKELQVLVDASLPHSYGAKMTGAGGGGSMIALTDEPELVAESIKKRGGVPFIVRSSLIGTEVRSGKE